MEAVKKSKTTPLITILFIASFIVALGSNFHHFLIEKNYNYLVEAACDPTVEECFFRDCSTIEDCPPNGFSYYKAYHVNANDFKTCDDNSCINECALESIQCEKITCDEESGDICEGTPAK